MIEAISAITLATHDMQRAVRFYSSLGFDMRRGGEAASFTSFRAGSICLNLIAEGEDKQWLWWGRVIFHVDDVDACYQRALAAGHQPSTTPRDAEWNERYFHLTDPDGHELSFARPLSQKTQAPDGQISSPLAQLARPESSPPDKNILVYENQNS